MMNSKYLTESARIADAYSKVCTTVSDGKTSSTNGFEKTSSTVETPKNMVHKEEIKPIHSDDKSNDETPDFVPEDHPEGFLDADEDDITDESVISDDDIETDSFETDSDEMKENNVKEAIAVVSDIAEKHNARIGSKYVSADGYSILTLIVNDPDKTNLTGFNMNYVMSVGDAIEEDMKKSGINGFVGANGYIGCTTTIRINEETPFINSESKKMPTTEELKKMNAACKKSKDYIENGFFDEMNDIVKQS